MARKHLLIMALVLVLTGSGGAGAMLWRGHDSGQAGAAADSAAAEAGSAAFFGMPLLLVPLGRPGEPVAYVPVAPELHLATEADKEEAERRFPHLQDRFVRAVYAGGQGGPMKDGALDLDALRVQLLAEARTAFGAGAVHDLTVTETMRQRR